MSRKLDMDVKIELYPGANNEDKGQFRSCRIKYVSIFREEPDELFLSNNDNKNKKDKSVTFRYYFFSNRYVVGFNNPEKTRRILHIFPLSKQVREVTVEYDGDQPSGFTATLNTVKLECTSCSGEDRDKLKDIIDEFIIPNLLGA